MNLSLLQNFTEKNFFLEPFPHLIIKNALPEKLYNELSNTFPINKFKNNDSNVNVNVNIKDSNVKLFLTPEKVQKDNEINDLWKNFISFNKSKTFCHQIFDIFSKNIVNTYPNIYKNKDELYNLKLATIDDTSASNADLFPYIEISCNAPVTKTNSVVSLHADNPNKLITALFYMREKDDFAGGDLNLHYWKINLPFFLKKIILSKKNTFLNNIIRKYQFLFIGVRKKIKYSSNVLVMYLDSINALHSVAPRSITNNYRKFCFYSLRLKYKKYLYKPYFGQAE